MGKYVMLFLLAVSVLGSTSYAESRPPGWVCPLKNLKKNQRRQADGTAFMPGSANKAGRQSNSIAAVPARN